MDKRCDRVVLLVDMDSFYCQVEEQQNPELKGRPSAVVQYNAWQGGGIIAVNYLARAKGVTRHMRGDEAKKMCPDIELVRVNSVHGKADLSKYREAGHKVAEVMARFQGILERASVDEAYMDISTVVNQRIETMNSGTYVLPPQQLENTYVPGYDSFAKYVSEILDKYLALDFAGGSVNSVDLSNLRLLVGAAVANEIRAAIKQETGYECSAGIAHNKILAKLACGLNKPNKQTILPLNQISKLFDKLPLRKLRGLGGKFGEDVSSRCNITFIGELTKFSELELQQLYDAKYGTWLYNICRGIDFEMVKPRSTSQSIGCCKKFPGRNKLADIDALEHWLFELSTEIQERLEKDVTMNNRRATHLVLNIALEIDNKDVAISRSRTLPSYEAEAISKCCLNIIKENMIPFFRPNSQKYLTHPIKYLGISTGKFTTNLSTNAKSIQTMFNNHTTKAKKNETIIVADSDNNEQTEKAHSKKISNPILKMFNNRFKKQQSLNSSISVKNIIDNRDDNRTDLCNRSSANLTLKESCTSIYDEESTTGSFFLQALKNIEKQSTELTKPIPVIEIPETSTTKLHRSSIESIMEPVTEPVTTIDAYTQNSNRIVLQTNLATEDTSKITIDQIENETQIISDNLSDSNDLQTKINAINNNTKIENHIDKKLLNNINEQVVGDYRTQYIEFALPTFNPQLLKYIQCNICGKDVLDNEIAIQTHKDYHFALQLNNQQREEYRKQVRQRTEMSLPSRPSKKMKSSNIQKAKKTVHITKYFQKQNITNK